MSDFYCYGDYLVTVFPDGTCIVDLYGMKESGPSLKFFEIVANLNVRYSEAKGYKTQKVIPKSEDQVQLEKEKKRQENIADGLKRQRESKGLS